MTTSTDRLYELLPRLYRQRDAAAGQPLRALMAVLEDEFLSIEGDIDALYKNAFIETCDKWVVPYIAELLGVEDLADAVYRHYTQRRRVANTTAYRRRKGTVATLEHVSFDVTGWTCRAVESAPLLAATQHLGRLRPGRGRTVNLRDRDALARLGGPFDELARGAELPRGPIGQAPTWPESGARPRTAHPAGLTLFFWRLAAHKVTDSVAYPGTDTVGKTNPPRLPPSCFTFDPCGRDLRLFQAAKPVGGFTQQVEDATASTEIDRAVFSADLADPANSIYYGRDHSLYITLEDESSQTREAVPADAVLSANLSRWPAESELAKWAKRNGDKRVAVDTVLGRFVVLPRDNDSAERRAVVNYTYALTGNLGGGPYARFGLGKDVPDGLWKVRVTAGDSLQKAFDEWSEFCRQHVARQADAGRPMEGLQGPSGVIFLVDSGLYEADRLRVVLPPGSALTIVASDGTRPAIRAGDGRMSVVLEGAESHALGSLDRRFHLNGIILEGLLTIDEPARSSSTLSKQIVPTHSRGKLSVEINDCTLPPKTTAPSLRCYTKEGSVDISRSILGSVQMPHQAELRIADSIIDGGPGVAIEGCPPLDAASDASLFEHGPITTLDRVTVFGDLLVSQVDHAANVIVQGAMKVRDIRAGSVSFSYFAVTTEHSDALIRRGGQLDPAGAGGVVRVLFDSVRYGDSDYARLNPQSSDAILYGGENGSQPGAFHALYLPQRQESFRRIIDEHMPLGWDVTIRYAT